MTPDPTLTVPMGPRFVCGLIGQGIGTSLTPDMHEAVADGMGLTYVYRRVDIHELGLSPEEAVQLIPAAGRLGFSGLNVTHPCKRLAVAQVDELSEAAVMIGAINTVVFTGGRAIGHNTDVTGFGWGFDRSMGDVGRERVILLGAGGAGAAVAHALLSRDAQEIVVVDIDPDRARALAEAVVDARGGRVRAGAPGGLAEELRRADGIVNCSPIGMTQYPGTPLDPGLLESRHWLIDVIYRPTVTELVRAAEARGCRVATGEGMAIGQAVDSFRLMTGLSPDPAAFEDAFARLVAREETAHVNA